METNLEAQESTLYIQGTLTVRSGMSPNEFTEQLTEWLTAQGAVFTGNMGPYVESQPGPQPEAN